MTAECCRTSIRARRRGEISAGALSLGVWMLLPKCPVCLAAHLAFWTGLGVSFTAAMYLRWTLLAVSGALLLYLALNQAKGNRWFRGLRVVLKTFDTAAVRVRRSIPLATRNEGQ